VNRRLSGLLKPKYTILGCDIAGVVEAAAVPLAAKTALQGLRDLGHIQSDKRF